VACDVEEDLLGGLDKQRDCGRRGHGMAWIGIGIGVGTLLVGKQYRAVACAGIVLAAKERHQHPHQQPLATLIAITRPQYVRLRPVGTVLLGGYGISISRVALAR